MQPAPPQAAQMRSKEDVSAVLKGVPVALGKDKMTVRVTGTLNW